VVCFAVNPNETVVVEEAEKISLPSSNTTVPFTVNEEDERDVVERPYWLYDDPELRRDSSEPDPTDQ